MNDEHIDVGAYALGLLEEQDSAAFEAHLAQCPSCHAELAEFLPMKALLTGLEPVESPEDQGVPDLLRRRAAVSRRRTRCVVAVGSAACVAALGGGLAAGYALAASPSSAIANCSWRNFPIRRPGRTTRSSRSRRPACAAAT